jgi:(p)ppGpp synthase/HD superfamily hydrolase
MQKRYMAPEQRETYPPPKRFISSQDNDFMQRTDPEPLQTSLLAQAHETLTKQGNQGSFEAVKQAIHLAHERHTDQLRDEGTPYILHIDRMLIYLLEDAPTFSQKDLPLALQITALHDTVEDTETSLSEIEQQFGKEVKDGVEALSREIHTEGRKISDEEYYNNLKNQPRYIQKIKVYDRIDNLYSVLNLNITDENKNKMTTRRVKALKDTKEHILPLLGADKNLQTKLETAYRTVIEQTPGEDIKHILSQN